MEAGELDSAEVIESIVNAQTIDKTPRSHGKYMRYSREKLYVIKSFGYAGTLIYTKGAIAKEAGQEVFYIFVSANVATTGA